MIYNIHFDKLATLFQEYEFKEDEQIMLINAEYSKGRYYITNYGNVLSLCQSRWHLLKPTIDKNGYYYVSFQHKRRRIKRYIHRLVAEYFVDNAAPQEKRIVHHIDKNRRNNHYSNLQWCDAKEHSLLHNDRSVDIECSKLEKDTCKKVQ